MRNSTIHSRPAAAPSGRRHAKYSLQFFFRTPLKFFSNKEKSILPGSVSNKSGGGASNARGQGVEEFKGRKRLARSLEKFVSMR